MEDTREDILEEEESFDEDVNIEPNQADREGHEIDLIPIIPSEDRALVPYDPLQLYLLEIKKYRLLTKEEEVELAIKVKEQNDPDAAYRLVTANLRLVVKIAMDFHRYWTKSLLDLIQEGNVGLLHAVKKYNPYKGTKFSTYAQFWIRAYILKFIMDTWSIVKIGTTQSQRKLFYRLKREKRKLENLGLYPAPKILANVLQVKEEEVVEMDARLSCGDIYLNSSVNEDRTETMMDLLVSDEDIEYEVSEKESREAIRERIQMFKATLNEKETCVFDNRLMADIPRTLEEIGSIFHISRERVRQIEQKVLQKAKKSFNVEIEGLCMWHQSGKAEYGLQSNQRFRDVRGAG